MQTSGCSHTRRPAVPPKFHHTYVRAKNKLRPPILSIHIYSECELDYKGTKFLSTCVWRSALWSSNLKVFKLIITKKKSHSVTLFTRTELCSVPMAFSDCHPARFKSFSQLLRKNFTCLLQIKSVMLLKHIHNSSNYLTWKASNFIFIVAF